MPASHKTKRGGGSAVALLLTVICVSCGGQSAAGAGAGGTSAVGGTGSPGGTGAGTSGRGGAAGDGGGQGRAGEGGVHIPLTDGTSGNGGSSGASGGVEQVEQAGDAGNAGGCDTNALWQALTQGAGATRCDLVDPPPEGAAVDQLHGAVVIDDKGRVIDNTGLTDAAKQGWLSELAGQRWLCLAGTTLGYSCQPIRG